jgi:cephalosporin hydroxylase
VALEVFDRVRDLIPESERVFVIEDSSHEYENTLGVLRTYSKLIHQGDYFVVEDGICRHGLSEGPSPGPFEAVHEFLRTNPDFEIDHSRESFLITWNPHGYLRRKVTSGIAGA